MKVLVVILVFLSFPTHALDIKYPVSAIPDSLKKGANAVIREKKWEFKINARDNAVHHVTEAITILNSEGKEYAEGVVFYDKLRKVTLFRGAVYDAAGNQIKRTKTSDIHDQSAISGFSLYEDNRVKWCDLTQANYPYTVEFEYEVVYQFLFYIPSYAPLSGEKVSLEKGSFTLEYPSESGLKPRIKYQNFPTRGKKEVGAKGTTQLVHTVSGMKAMKREPFGPSIQELLPVVFAAPTDFEFEKYTGTLNTWKDFGIWINTLNKGRDVLPDQAKNEIKNLTKGLSTVEEKAKAIYEYMQSRTRYVSIQMGIGGFQPFEASVVDQTGYGDCKALSNYMVAMLKEAGIPANYTLIRAGEDASAINSDFPSTQFNHAIVFVPNRTDTLWLECTSQTTPFGYLGTFTFDRQALAITDQGAKIVRTPSYAPEVNTQVRSADVFVDDKGDGAAKVRTSYSGLKYESNNLNFVLGNQFDEQKKWVLQNTQIPSFDAEKIVLTNAKAKIPTATVQLDLKLKKLATTSGKRMFIMPNLMNRSDILPEKIENRETEIVKRFGFIELDTIRYHIPPHLYPEYMPQRVNINSIFGEYEASFELNEGTIVYTRKLRVNAGRYPATHYKEFVEFYRNINKADNIKLVFLNKT